MAVTYTPHRATPSPLHANGAPARSAAARHAQELYWLRDEVGRLRDEVRRLQEVADRRKRDLERNSDIIHGLKQQLTRLTTTRRRAGRRT